MKKKIDWKLTRKQVEDAYPEWAMYEANKNGMLFDPVTKARVVYPEDHFNKEEVAKGEEAWKKLKRGRWIALITGGALTVGGATYMIVKHVKGNNQTETEEPIENIEG